MKEKKKVQYNINIKDHIIIIQYLTTMLMSETRKNINLYVIHSAFKTFH